MANKIKVTFLGTSASTPSAMRNHPAMLLNYNEENILIDCGEGTQRQFRKARLNPCKVTKILITHWHGDHVLGIPGLLQTLVLSGYNKTLEIYGPKGTKRFMEAMLDTFKFKKENLKFQIKEITNKGKFFEGKDFFLETEQMEHGTPTNAYNFILKDRIRIDVAKLKKAKIPAGPSLKKLKEGKDITFEGKKYKSKDLTYTDKGKKISFVMDTVMNPKISKFVKDADVFICESSFDSTMKDFAKSHLHLTVDQTASIAKKAKVGKLYLTHISARYEPKMKSIRDEARELFKESYLAKDLEGFEI